MTVRYQQVTNDVNIIFCLESFRLTLPPTYEMTFWSSLEKFGDLKLFFANLSMKTWGWYFNPETSDDYLITYRIFVILSGIIHCDTLGPSCPKCKGPMKASRDVDAPFGWRYRCISSKQLSQKQKRAKKGSMPKKCTGSLFPTHNTWIDGCKNISDGLFLMFAR